VRSAAVCPNCGATERPGLVDAVRTEWDPSSGDARLEVTDPLGSRSNAHGDAAHYSLNVEGVGGVGAPAEGRIASMIRNALAAQGISARVEDGADNRGDDRRLRVGERVYGLQVTVAPSASDFWSTASVSSASTVVGQSHAIEWLRSPITEKAAQIPRVDRATTVLGIDVTHAGVVADPTFLREYLKKYECPSTEFGFASVWVVGPTDYYCNRLGEGVP
jgi:hypothetical protein